MIVPKKPSPFPPALRTLRSIAVLALLAATPLRAAPSLENCTMRYTGPLATDDQINSEKLALRIFASPEVKKLRPQLRKILEEDPAGKIPDGAAQIDHVLDLWSMAMIMWEVGGDTFRPQILWHVDNSPHCWFGHEMQGMGAAGDNPDHIYRGAFLNGDSTYEVKGQFGMNRPSQLSFEIFKGAPGKTVITQQTSKTPDLGNQVSLIMSSNMNIAPDGSFTVTIGPDTNSKDPNYLHTAPGPLQLAIRDVLSDWNENPTAVTIKRTSGPDASAPLTEQQLLSEIVTDLPGFVRFWSGFKTNWLGGIADNKVVGPAPRAGGWGYLLGGRFNLTDDDAITITITDVGASYIGFQLLSPWLMMPVDTRNGTYSLNNGQVQRNPDNSVTYVLSPKDPGVANWIDTAGLHQGMYIVRWQGVPAGADAKDMVKDFKVIRLADVGTTIPATVPRIDAAGRAAQVKKRTTEFDLRLGTAAR